MRLCESRGSGGGWSLGGSGAGESRALVAVVVLSPAQPLTHIFSPLRLGLVYFRVLCPPTVFRFSLSFALIYLFTKLRVKEMMPGYLLSLLGM